MNLPADLRRPDSRFQNLLSLRAATYAGVGGALITVVVAGWPQVGLVLGCLSVVVLYSVYPTLSLVWGTRAERLTEWAFLAAAVISIALAVTVSGRWLALGWALHGVWDLLHHHDRHVLGLRGIPPWYVHMCWIWDLLAALGLLLVL
ncbi:hypothetical protein NBCG_02744 [Nocardioidaceae bacterium Broad-1]|uniref:hypothetical protein n=1 Tax=Nocardioides luteus TaxID=1844 RepID=UPI00020285FC|nr:hypothetical protein [Nocardioides luteus]EGD42989.1 hypothetical protein NBCG_02744 [Nocardioidaceae bacterium Broad-1]MBG6096679.1 hypothetical protein [Nocardioides luteus]